MGDISESSLTDRLILGEEGFISVVAAVDLRTSSIVAGPDVSARGFIEDSHVFDEVTEQIREGIQDALDKGQDDTFRLQQIARRIIGKWVSRTYRRRPMIVPVVIAI